MTMGRRPGSASPPTLPFTATPIEHEGPGRPDKRIPDQCDSCKVPARIEKLMTFRLWHPGAAKWAGEWTLCGKCWAWRNERPDPDPRHVDEAA